MANVFVMLRVIFFIFEIMQRYFSFILDQLEMQEYFFLVVFFALIFQEFKYAEIAYHFCFEKLFKMNEELIVGARSSIMNLYRENVHKWWNYIIKNLVAIGSALSKMLPAPIQAFTNPFFDRLMSGYDQAYA